MVKLPSRTTMLQLIGLVCFIVGVGIISHGMTEAQETTGIAIQIENSSTTTTATAIHYDDLGAENQGHFNEMLRGVNGNFSGIAAVSNTSSIPFWANNVFEHNGTYYTVALIGPDNKMARDVTDSYLPRLFFGIGTVMLVISVLAFIGAQFIYRRRKDT
ncbi:hypothetical protein [Halocatena marina]|uniref:hypothetical protein n=1 Tax=Halocatena marina TaxID=2934937 RepID=UPI00200F8CB8|nr:hypothetical protein [Halocatena marina]